MAHSAKGRELTEAHRQAQARTSASLADILRDIFLDAFRPADINGSSRVFIRKALPVLLEAREISHATATDYLDAFRRAELRELVDHTELQGDLGDPLTASPEDLARWAEADLETPSGLEDLPDVEDLAVQLHSSGAAVAKRAISKGRSIDQAKKTAADAVAAKGVKLAADGGRAPLQAEVRQGRNGAVGYARVADADPCPFCAMLASRGAVYRSDSFEDSAGLFSGDGKFKVHDGCGCTLEPVYGRRATDLPPGSAELAAQWAEIASGQPDPFAAWSRWIASGTRPGEERSNADTATVTASAPQYGRGRAKPGAKPRRKSIGELDQAELAQTLQGLYVRRAGMEAQLADLEARGQSVTEPGPAQAINRQLDRVEKQITHARKRLGTLTP